MSGESGIRIRGLSLSLGVLLFLLLLAPSARADTHTFLNLTTIFPTGGAGELGPSDPFPTSIGVSGLQGTLNKATVTLLGYDSANADDADFALVGPNGAKVMLLSDACGDNAIGNHNWTFDDAAGSLVPDGGPCGNYTTASYRPSNHVGGAPEPDDLSGAGGPGPPFGSALSVFNGGSPNGTWGLYAFDDNAGAGAGFGISGWALTLDVQPPPPATPTTTPAAATGQRAAALAKCKKKKRKARKKCKKKAALLPA